MKKVVATLAMAGAMVTSSTAFAGANSNSTVTVNSSSAYGQLTQTRFSSSPGEQLGCRISTSATGTPVVACYAQDDNNNTLSCYSTASQFLDAVSSVSDSTYVYFSVNSSNGQCNYISVYNYSNYID